MTSYYGVPIGWFYIPRQHLKSRSLPGAVHAQHTVTLRCTYESKIKI